MTSDLDSLTEQTFDDVAATAAERGMTAATRLLAEQFRASEHYHELFDLASE